jgi:hypothetical protein
MKKLKKKTAGDHKKKPSEIISDQFKENRDLQKDRQDHKKYEGEGYGENFKDKDYNGTNYKQEDDYNSNKLGNGSEAVDENTRKKTKRKTKE